MKTNPVAAADLRASFGHAGALRVWAIFLGTLAVVLYAWWPRGLIWHLHNAAPPQTFAAVTVVLFVLSGFLSARAGAGEHAPPGETALSDLVALTPVRVAVVVAGRLGAGALAVLFQLALGLPFLVVALGVSGLSPSVLPAVAAVVACSAMAWRASALALRLVLPEHPILRDLLLLASSAVYLAATFVAVPAANPLTALVDLADGRDRVLAAAGVSLPFFAVSAIIGLLVTAAATVVTSAALHAARTAAKGGQSHERDGAGQRG